MVRLILIHIVLLAYLAGSSASTSHDIASALCKNSHAAAKDHFTTLASVSGVIDFLSDLPRGHKLEECRDKYLESLKQLVHVVDTASSDVCGDEKLALLEEYHRRYISKIRKHEKERKHRNKAPRLAKLFFMEYALKVSSICEQAAMESIFIDKQTISEEHTALLNNMKPFTDTLGVMDLSKGYAGVYLFWNMVDSLDLHKKDKFAKYLAEGGDTRFNIQLKKAQDLAAVQAICRSQLKPIYSKSILPVLRLVDMGYYPQSTALIKTEGVAKDLLLATQICESLLPVSIYMNDNLNDDEVIVLTKEEAAQMEQYKPPTSGETAPQLERSPSFLSSVELSIAYTKSYKVKASVSSRGQIFIRMVRNVAKHLRNLKSVLKVFKFFKRDKSNKLQAINGDNLEQVAEQSLQVYNKQERGLVRRKKREVITIFLGTLACINFLLALYNLIKQRQFRQQWAQLFKKVVLQDGANKSN